MYVPHSSRSVSLLWLLRCWLQAGNTPLTLATECKHVELIEELLAGGALVDYPRAVRARGALVLRGWRAELMCWDAWDVLGCVGCVGCVACVPRMG